MKRKISVKIKKRKDSRSGRSQEDIELVRFDENDDDDENIS